MAHASASKAMREQMAIMHQQMAACLRSEKAISECQSQMMKDCQSMMGGKGCSMMSMGNMKGTHDRMMQGHPPADTDRK